MLLSDVWRLSIAYIGRNSRIERPRKTKIGTVVAHVTCDSDTTFKVKRSKVKVTRPLCSPPCWRVRQPQRWAWERVCREKLRLRCRLLGRARRASAPTGEERGGAYRGGRPPTACCIISQRHWIKSSAILFGSVDISRWRPNLSRGFISLRLTGENVLRTRT